MVLLAAAMFVLVVDTSLMNVSISAVVKDLDTTASGVQSAIALEALVSAAFILISSKIGDLIGRKRAYVIGLLAYAVGALAMTVAQSLTAIIIFWAIIGGLGASLLLPAMQSLIHGNFDGRGAEEGLRPRRRRGRDRRRGRPAARRVRHHLPVVAGRLRRSRSSSSPSCSPDPAGPATSRTPVPPDRPGRRGAVGRRHGRRRARHPRVAGGRRGRRRCSSRIGAVALALLAWWLVQRKRAGKPTLLDPDLFRHPNFRIGITRQMMQQITLGGAMIALPLFLQMTLEYNAMEAGLSLAPLSLTHVRRGAARRAGRPASGARPTSSWSASCSSTVGMRVDHPARAAGRLRLVARRPAR